MFLRSLLILTILTSEKILAWTWAPLEEGGLGLRGLMGKYEQLQDSRIPTQKRYNFIRNYLILRIMRSPEDLRSPAMAKRDSIIERALPKDEKVQVILKTMRSQAGVKARKTKRTSTIRIL